MNLNKKKFGIKKPQSLGHCEALTVSCKFNSFNRSVAFDRHNGHRAIAWHQTVTRIPSSIWSRLLRAMCERRVSSQNMVKSLTLNPYMSLLNLKLWTHNWSSEQISILDPPNIGLFGPSWFELSPYAGEGSVGPATYFFVTDGQKRDYLSRASQRAKGATRNPHNLILLQSVNCLQSC